ncbi:MAG: TolC family protein, partial [Acidobacteriota bacterium]
HLEHRRVVLESTRDVLVARINALLHRSPDEPLPPPPGVLPDPSSLPEDSGGLQQLALDGRPALRAQDSTIRARQFEVELRRKDFRPDLEVGTSWNSMWNTEEHRWIVGASINLPVRRKRLRAGVAQAEARWRSAQSARLQLEDDVRSEVQQAWTRAIESRHIVELHRSRLLPAANDQVQAALSGFKTGRNSFLAVIEAERNQRTTELGYERSLSELHQRLAELDRVLGRMPGGPRATMEPIAATGARP